MQKTGLEEVCMSKKLGNQFIIEKEKSDECEYCGKVAELRPYGRNGARICFECGMKDENKVTTDKQFDKVLNGIDVVVDNRGTKH
jgi:hypothetical protein